MPRNWYKIQSRAEGETEIAIHDEIGMFGVTARDFIRDLKAIDTPKITVSINSPGGAVFDALPIYNALIRHDAEITTRVEGLAASAASVITMAGDRVVMPENAFLMIHNPWSFSIGDANEMRQQADLLDKVSASLISTYRNKTGMEDSEIAAMLDAETWLSAEEAVEFGFADEIEPGMQAVACVGIERMPANVQAALGVTGEEGDDEPQRPNNDGATDEPAEGEDAATDVEPEPATDATEAEPQASAEPEAPAKSDAQNIAELCMTAERPELAAQMIAAGLSIDDARDSLIRELAKADKPGPAPSSHGTETINPWKPETRDLRAQNRITHEDPELAARMRSEAGL